MNKRQFVVMVFFITAGITIVSAMFSITNVEIPAFAEETHEQEEARKQFEKLKRSEVGPTLISVVQYVLWQLGYYGTPITGKIDKLTQKALHEYQHRRRIKVTGDLNLETFEIIEKDGSLLEPIPVGLGSYFFFDDSWDSYFMAKGTWVFENKEDKMGWPLQTSKIVCYRDLGYCFEAIANTTSTSSIGTLVVDLEVYKVARWDNFEIVTGPYDFSCTRYTLRVNRIQKAVKKLRTTLRGKTECRDVKAKDYYMHLVSGSDVWKDLYEERKKALEKVRSSSIPNLIK